MEVVKLENASMKTVGWCGKALAEGRALPRPFRIHVNHPNMAVTTRSRLSDDLFPENTVGLLCRPNPTIKPARQLLSPNPVPRRTKVLARLKRQVIRPSSSVSSAICRDSPCDWTGRGTTRAYIPTQPRQYGLGNTQDVFIVTVE